jgi:hypothetical protein
LALTVVVYNHHYYDEAGHLSDKGDHREVFRAGNHIHDCKELFLGKVLVLLLRTQGVFLFLRFVGGSNLLVARRAVIALLTTFLDVVR